MLGARWKQTIAKNLEFFPETFALHQFSIVVSFYVHSASNLEAQVAPQLRIPAERFVAHFPRTVTERKRRASGLPTALHELSITLQDKSSAGVLSTAEIQMQPCERISCMASLRHHLWLSHCYSIQPFRSTSDVFEEALSSKKFFFQVEEQGFQTGMKSKMVGTYYHQRPRRALSFTLNSRCIGKSIVKIAIFCGILSYLLIARMKLLY